MQAFLDMIAKCEGTDGWDGYRALFGYTKANGKVFDGYVDHPNQKYPFTQTDGTVGYSTAAGRYQILYPVWKELKAKLGLVDFTPQSQDACAVELIRERGALGLVEAGDLQGAIDRCSTIWASLPASHYPQPKRTFAFASEAYTDAGGSLA